MNTESWDLGGDASFLLTAGGVLLADSRGGVHTALAVNFLPASQLVWFAANWPIALSFCSFDRLEFLILAITFTFATLVNFFASIIVNVCLGLALS